MDESRKTMSGRERIKKFREKHKHYPEYRQKDNERIGKLRKDQIARMSEDELIACKAANAERSRKYRQAAATKHEK